jgi:uncharacterized alpha-E superfamily protein
MVVEQSLIVQGYIAHTLLHDHTWYLLRLGKHIEAAAQITRILIAKSKDIIAANQTGLGKAVETYQIITLLKTTEAFDMSRIHYKDVPNFTDTLEFLILNKEFPRSIHYSLESVHRSLQNIQLPSEDFKKSPEFFVGKKNSSFSYMTVEDIENEVLPFLERTLKDIYYMGELIIHKLS